MNSLGFYNYKSVFSIKVYLSLLVVSVVNPAVLGGILLRDHVHYFHGLLVLLWRTSRTLALDERWYKFCLKSKLD